MAQPTRNRWLVKGQTLKLNRVHREIAGLLLMVLALITLLGLFSASRGVVIDLWVWVLRLLFGWGAYPAGVGFGLAGGALFLKSLRRQPEVHWPVVIGWEMAYIGLLALLHLLSSSDDLRTPADAGEGGGMVVRTRSKTSVRRCRVSSRGERKWIF